MNRRDAGIEIAEDSHGLLKFLENSVYSKVCVYVKVIPCVFFGILTNSDVDLEVQIHLLHFGHQNDLHEK